MNLNISLPKDLVAFAEEEAKSRGATLSGLLAALLEEELHLRELQAYLDRYGWDAAEDERAWREYQIARMAEEYSADNW